MGVVGQASSNHPASFLNHPHSLGRVTSMEGPLSLYTSSMAPPVLGPPSSSLISPQVVAQACTSPPVDPVRGLANTKPPMQLLGPPSLPQPSWTDNLTNLDLDSHPLSPVVMAGMTLPPPLWPRMPSLVKQAPSHLLYSL